jgi:hypothetical protein
MPIIDVNHTRESRSQCLSRVLKLNSVQNDRSVILATHNLCQMNSGGFRSDADIDLCETTETSSSQDGRATNFMQLLLLTNEREPALQHQHAIFADLICHTRPHGHAIGDSRCRNFPSESPPLFSHFRGDELIIVSAASATSSIIITILIHQGGNSEILGSIPSARRFFFQLSHDGLRTVSRVATRGYLQVQLTSHRPATHHRPGMGSTVDNLIEI